MEGNKEMKKNESLADAMIDKIRKALNAEAKSKNAPRRYQIAEAASERDDDEVRKLEDE